MERRFLIIAFLLITITFFSYMFHIENQKVNAQLDINTMLKEKVDQSYLIIDTANSTLKDRKILLDEKINYINQLTLEEKSLQEKQNDLTLQVFSYRVYETNDPRDFVDVNDPNVQYTLTQIITPSMGDGEKVRAIFNYVRDDIIKEEKLTRNGRIDYWNYPKNIIETKKGEYEDKIILLASMLRTAGFNESDVEVVGAKLELAGSTSSDIWVELKFNGRTYLLLPRLNNNYDSFNKDEIYSLYKVEELYKLSCKFSFCICLFNILRPNIKRAKNRTYR